MLQYINYGGSNIAQKYHMLMERFLAGKSSLRLSLCRHKVQALQKLELLKHFIVTPDKFHVLLLRAVGKYLLGVECILWNMLYARVDIARRQKDIGFPMEFSFS